MASSKTHGGRFGSVLLQKQQPKAIQIRLVRSGHNAFKAEVPMKIVPQQYASFGELLHEATEIVKAANVSLNRGGIKSLHTIHGKEVVLIDDLEDKAMYIATCANERFKTIPYALSSTAQKTNMHSVATSTTSLVSSQGESQLQARRITLIRQGKRPRQVFSLLLNRKTAHGFEKVLSDISELVHLDSGPLHIVFTQSGRVVSCLEDFFGYHYIFFAFRKEMAYCFEDFILDQKEIEIINKLNRRSSEKCVISPPVKSKNEMLTREIAPQIRVKYNIGRNIYKGQFVALNECTSKGGNRNNTASRYAMKIISKTDKNYECIRNEVLMMKGLRHASIIRLVSVHDSPRQVYMILEMATEGDLYTALLSSRIAEDEAKTFTENIASALFYIHCSYIVHRNVKPSNLLIARGSSGRRVLKLTGFSLASVAFEPLYEICGRTLYMAPEMLTESGYGGKVDVWAAGVVVYYMLVQVPPFLGETDEDDERLILEGNVDFSWEEWSDISFEAKELISYMLNYEPESRFSTEEVLEHPWIIERTFHKELSCATVTDVPRDIAEESAGDTNKYVTGKSQVESKRDEDVEDVKRSDESFSDTDTSTLVEGSVCKSEDWETEEEGDATEDEIDATEDVGDEIEEKGHEISVVTDALALNFESLRKRDSDNEKYESGRKSFGSQCSVGKEASTINVRECGISLLNDDHSLEGNLNAIYGDDIDADLQEEQTASNDGYETDTETVVFDFGEENDRDMKEQTETMEIMDEVSSDAQEKDADISDERETNIGSCRAGDVVYDQGDNCSRINEQSRHRESDNVHEMSRTERTLDGISNDVVVQEAIKEVNKEVSLATEKNASGDHGKDAVVGSKVRDHGFGDEKSPENSNEEEDDEWEDAV